MSEPPHESTDQLVPMTVVYVYTYMVGQPTVSSVRTKKSHIFTRAILSLFLEKSRHTSIHIKGGLVNLGVVFHCGVVDIYYHTELCVVSGSALSFAAGW